MIRRTSLVALAASACVLIGAVPASAHQNPLNCDSNSPSLRVARDRPLVRVGESVTYTVYAANPGATACDITNLAIYLQLPGADGQPVASLTTIAQGLDLPSNTPERQVGRVSTVLNVNPGVTDAIARASTTGVLHDSVNDHDAAISKTIGTTIVTPGIEVTKVGSIRNGAAPQDVTYTFTVYNRSQPPVPLDNVTVSDSLCPGTVGPISGDVNGDRRLDPGDAWVYTCTMNHPVAGVYNNTVTACAELILNGVTQRVCDQDVWSVTLTPPAPAQQGAVKPVAVSQGSCTLARVNSTTVRAGQLNTVRVRVRSVDAGTTVKLTLPGGKTVSAKTDKNGLATFRVRPTRSGTARIQAAECSDVENLSVKPARRVVAKRAPRVTG